MHISAVLQLLSCASGYLADTKGPQHCPFHVVLQGFPLVLSSGAALREMCLAHSFEVALSSSPKTWNMKKISGFVGVQSLLISFT